jgi:hypothetical protein
LEFDPTLLTWTTDPYVFRIDTDGFRIDTDHQM